MLNVQDKAHDMNSLQRGVVEIQNGVRGLQQRMFWFDQFRSSVLKQCNLFSQSLQRNFRVFQGSFLYLLTGFLSKDLYLNA